MIVQVNSLAMLAADVVEKAKPNEEFAVGGILTIIMVFIGLYSWGASWRHNLHRGDIKPEVAR